MRPMFARSLAVVATAVLGTLAVAAPALAQEDTTTTAPGDSITTTTVADGTTTTTTPEDAGELIPLPGTATTTSTTTTAPGDATATTIAGAGGVDDATGSVTPAQVVTPNRVSAGAGGTADGAPGHPATIAVVLAVALTMAAAAFIARSRMLRQ